VIPLENSAAGENARRPWLSLDPSYYIRECMLRGIAVASRKPEYLIRHYMDNAGKCVLSPNPLFDESYYRDRYPEIRHDIARGRFHSGFDHFVRVGAQAGLSPAWFFSGAWYAASNVGLDEQSLRVKGIPDSYSEYLTDGLKNDRGGIWLTAQVAYNGSVDGLAAKRPLNLEELLATLSDERRLAGWLLPLFDAAWFATKYNTGGRVREDIVRYLTTTGASALSPAATFDEAYYVRENPDVAAALASGTFPCGFQHFLQFGMHENRRPFESFDTAHYLTANPGVSEECDKRGIPAYLHFLNLRRGRMLELAPPFGTRDIPEAAGKGVYERRAQLVAAMVPCDLRLSTPPVVSVIVIARNKFAETFACIQSVKAGTSLPLEIILYDNGSIDEIKDIEDIVPGIRCVRATSNQGFTIPVNEAAELARGRYILLVNNDTEIVPHAVDRAIEVLENDPSIGIVGGRIIRTHGLLQEAGSIVWRDGSCRGYGRDLDPFDGRVSFAYDVDYCSGCFLAISTEDWRTLGGFDPAYAPAYYEEVDLCLRVWEMGKRVVYDPTITLWHFEYGSSTIPEEAIALMRRNQRYFAAKHHAYLAQCHPPSDGAVEAARLRLCARPRILFIEDELPDAQLGMGFVRSAKIASLLQDLAGHLTIVGVNPSRTKRRKWDRCGWGPHTQVLPDVDRTNFVQFLRERVGVYDILWLSRTHNLRLLREWRNAAPEFFKDVRIVLDTEAIASARMIYQAQMLGEAPDIDELLADELLGAESATAICAVNDLDRALIQRDAIARGTRPALHIVGYAVTPAEEVAPFGETAGIYLTGSFGYKYSPNTDAMRWFDAAVRPLLPARLAGVPITIAGYKAKEFVDEAGLAGAYDVLSDLPDMAVLYRGARLVIAPTRFAGGIPLKVLEAASFGVPVVMSELLGTQLGWADDPDIAMVPGTTPEGFASLIDRLYFDEQRWTACRDRQLQRVQAEATERRFVEAITAIVRGETESEDRPQARARVGGKRKAAARSGV